MNRLGLILFLAVLMVPCIYATQVVSKTLPQLITESDHVLLVKVVKVDAIDFEGNQLTGLNARTGPGSGNQIRLHVEVVEDGIIATNGPKDIKELIVPLWGMWHYRLSQWKPNEGKMFIFLLKGEEYKWVHPIGFMRKLHEQDRINDLLAKKAGRLTLYDKARQLYGEGFTKRKEALDLAKRAVDLDPDDREARSLLGLMLFDLKEFPAAAVQFGNVLDHAVARMKRDPKVTLPVNLIILRIRALAYGSRIREAKTDLAKYRDHIPGKETREEYQQMVAELAYIERLVFFGTAHAVIKAQAEVPLEGYIFVLANSDNKDAMTNDGDVGPFLALAGKKGDWAMALALPPEGAQKYCVYFEKDRPVGYVAFDGEVSKDNTLALAKDFKALRKQGGLLNANPDIWKPIKLATDDDVPFLGLVCQKPAPKKPDFEEGPVRKLEGDGHVSMTFYTNLMDRKITHSVFIRPRTMVAETLEGQMGLEAAGVTIFHKDLTWLEEIPLEITHKDETYKAIKKTFKIKEKDGTESYSEMILWMYEGRCLKLRTTAAMKDKDLAQQRSYKLIEVLDWDVKVD